MAAAAPVEPLSCGSIVLREHFSCKPEQLFRALTEPHLVKQFTNSKEGFVCEPHAGGRMRLFDGHIVCENVQVMPTTRLVQKWREVTWPDGLYSLVTFDLAADGDGTELTLTHEQVPKYEDEECWQKSWQKYYWDPLKKLLAE